MSGVQKQDHCEPSRQCGPARKIRLPRGAARDGCRRRRSREKHRRSGKETWRAGCDDRGFAREARWPAEAGIRGEIKTRGAGAAKGDCTCGARAKTKILVRLISKPRPRG